MRSRERRNRPPKRARSFVESRDRYPLPCVLPFFLPFFFLSLGVVRHAITVAKARGKERKRNFAVTLEVAALNVVGLSPRRMKRISSIIIHLIFPSSTHFSKKYLRKKWRKCKSFLTRLERGKTFTDIEFTTNLRRHGWSGFDKRRVPSQ